MWLGRKRAPNSSGDGDALHAGGPVDEGGVDERAGNGWGIDAHARELSNHVLEGTGPIEGARKHGYAFAHYSRLHAREVCDVLADLAEACHLLPSRSMTR